MQPTLSGLHAALSFWKRQDAETQTVLKRCGLDPVRWWKTADVALEASLALARHHGQTQHSGSSLLFAWEFRYATVFGGMDVLEWTRDRKFGALTNVRFVQLDDPWDEWHTLVRHNADSPWMIKWKNRSRLKAMLPRQYRAAVALARKSSFSDFRITVIGGWSVHPQRYQPKLVIASLREMSNEGRVRNLSVNESTDGDGALASWEAYNTPREKFAGLCQCIESLGLSLRQFWRISKGREQLSESRQRVLFGLETS